MNLNLPMLRPLRILLFPFSLLYALAIILRNWLFDKHILSTTSFNLPVICIGNLAVGGTGKSPMVEFLIKKLSGQFQVAVLSRGYKRKTRGYALANETSTALDIGDEPMQFHSKFPKVTIAVGEERVFAIPQLLHDHPDTRTIILDDAFQHRSVKAGLNILLTDYSNLFTRDWYLPSGDLRDEKRSYKRSELIVVTKCKPHFSEKESQEIIKEINPLPSQEIFFSTIQYGNIYHIVNKNSIKIKHDMEVLLVAGIANPSPLKKWLELLCKSYDEISYSDHHIFSIDDLENMINRFETMDTNHKIILTTEKDAVRLVKFQQELIKWPFYVVPIETVFLFDGERAITDLIIKFITEFTSPG